MRTNNKDIVLISETHIFNKKLFEIKGYCSYWSTHPSDRANRGTTLLIKQNIQHFLQQEIRETFIQTNNVTIQHNGAAFNIGAAYCSPRCIISKREYIDIFKTLGPRFIIGGDFNVEHTGWGSRLTH
jgi:exonuclease III